MNREMLMLVEAIAREKNVDRDVVFEAVEQALAQATKKQYPGEVDIRVAIDRETGQYDTFRRWLVVPDDAGLQNPDAEEMMMDAQERKPGVVEGDFIEEAVPSLPIGRIGAMTAKQVVLQRIRDAFGVQLARETGPDAPHLLHRGCGEHRLQVRRGQVPKIANLRQLAWVGSWLALGCFGDVIGQFRQRFGRADADAAGDVDPLQDAFAHRPRARRYLTDAINTDEALIDAVDLLLRPEPRSQTHHPSAQISVQSKVGAQRCDHARLELVADLEIGHPHLDPQGLGLVASSDRAAIVVGQHHDGTAAQAGAKHALATDVEVVAVNEGEHDQMWTRMRMRPVATAQICTVSPSLGTMSG